MAFRHHLRRRITGRRCRSARLILRWRCADVTASAGLIRVLIGGIAGHRVLGSVIGVTRTFFGFT